MENPVGAGTGFYIGVQYQKGYGLHGLLATLGHFVLPILKPDTKAVGRQARKVASVFAYDLLPGESLERRYPNSTIMVPHGEWMICCVERNNQIGKKQKIT